MILWHKRLLIFLGKILGILVIILVIAFFLFYYYYFKKDNLIKYVPPEAVVYATFRFDSNLLANPLLAKIISNFQSENNLPSLDIQALNQLINYNSAIAIVPLVKDRQIAFDYLLFFDLKLNSQPPQEYLDYFANSNWPTKVIQINALGKKILIASNSADLIARVEKIASQQESSLVNNVNVVYNLRKINNNSFAKIYVNLAQLAKDISYTEDLPWKLFLASMVVEDNIQLFLGLKTEDNQLVLQTTDFEKNDQVVWIMQKFPRDFKFTLNLTTYPHKITEYKELLAIIDKPASALLQANKQKFEAVYDISLENDILPALAPFAQVIMDQQNDWFVSLDYQQVTNKEQYISNLEKLLIKYLATAYPIEVQKVLPDKTTITQIVKDKQLHFEDEKLANLSLRTLKYDKSSLNYYLIGENVILANNKEKLVNLIKYLPIHISSDDYVDRGKSFHGDNNIVINGSYIAKYLPYFSEISRIIINDNLLGYPSYGFRLILE